MNSEEHVDKPITTNKSRRHFIAGITAIVGSAGAASLLGGKGISVAMAYTPDPNSAKTNGKILNQPQMAQLRDICAVVIPKTETLGAAEVDTHGFIDNQLFHCHTKDQQQQAVSILKKIDEVTSGRLNKSFANCDKQQQYDLLTSLEQSENGFNNEDKQNFKFVKALLIYGYYTSEVGASKELAYLAIPGGFTGSVPYDSVGKGWGSMSYY
ncbi:MAG: hypothetical protein ACI8R9_000662 [Paraglaciecola sp.]|jgi:hypothetical protein